MAIKNLFRKVVRATPALIEEFSTMTMAKQDRPLKPQLLASLRAKVLKGEFLSTTWAAAKCNQDGRTYRVNGKHTSTLFSQMNGELPKGTEVTLERYECDTLEDVAALYARFDPRGSVRSHGDINRIYQSTCEELEGVQTKIFTNCVTAIAYAENETAYSSVPAEVRASNAVKHKDFVLWVQDLFGGESKEARHLLRSPVIAAIWKTYNKNKEAAGKFWKLVKTGDGLPGCPTRKLERLLLSSSISMGRGATHRKQVSLGQREMYVKCIHAWNAWRTNKATDLKYHADAATPDVK